MASYRELLVKIGADTSSLSSGLSGITGQLGSLGTIATVAGAAVAAIGVAAFKVGLDFEAANKSIRVGTGATGEALEGLKQSAKNVFTGVPESIGQVSKTLADLNTATGLTGQPLEKMTTQMLDLQRLGTGFSGDVMTLTRVFGDWGDAIEDPNEALDFLFKTSQSTGVGIDELAGKVVQFGAPLRTVGFDFEQATALMGNFGKLGVNTETVMAGLATATKKLSEMGGDLPTNFRAVIDSIKNAGSAAEANSIAFEIFGQRAGTNMVDAINNSAFSVDELVATLDASKESISGAAYETASLGEKLSTMTNWVSAALAPLGSLMVDGLVKMADIIRDSTTPALEAVQNALVAFNDYVQPLTDGLTAVLMPALNIVGNLLIVVGGILWKLVEVIGPPVLGVLDKIAYVVLEVLGAALKGVGFLLEGFNDALRMIPGVADAGDKAIAGVSGGLEAVGLTAKDANKGLGDLAKEGDGATKSVGNLAAAIGDESKPKTLTGSIAKAEVKFFDLTKWLKEAGKDTRDFKEGLKAATKDGAEKFTKSVENMGGALDDWERDSGSAERAVSADMQRVFDAIQKPSTELAKIPAKAKDVEAAFAALETKGTSELKELYESAKSNFDLIQDSGEATPRQISEAWRNELQAQKDMLAAQGLELSAEESKILADLNRKLQTGAQVMETTWGTFATNVGGTISQLGEDLFSDLLEGKFSLSTITSALGTIKDAFATALFTPVKNAINDFITQSLDKLIGKLTGTGGVSDALGKAFGGGGGSSGGGGVPGVPSGGGAASSGGGIASSMGGIAGAVSVVSGVVSAISGVVSNFQFAAMNKSLDLIETATRRTDIGITQPGGMIDLMHGYLGVDQWARQDQILGQYDRLSLDGWQQTGMIGSILTYIKDTGLPEIKTSNERVSASVDQLSSAVMALADRAVQVLLDGDVIAEGVSRRLANQLAAA